MQWSMVKLSMNEDKLHQTGSQELVVTFNVESELQTQKFAEAFARYLNPGDVVCLSGDLGAGKTFFSQALCKELGVDDYVTSPTFNIMNQYEGRLPIYHFDVYRISDEDEMYEIGFDDFLYGKGICLVEWASLVENLIPKDAIWIDIKIMGETSRVFTVSGGPEKLGRLAHEVIGH